MGKMRKFFRNITILRDTWRYLLRMNNRRMILARDRKMIRDNVGVKRCSVCGNRVGMYLPRSTGLVEACMNYGYNPDKRRPETCNDASYRCPYCLASDRNRLMALYIDSSFLSADNPKVLDIAPSKPFTNFIEMRFPKFEYKTMDLYMDGVDYQLDITDMHALEDEGFDLFMCSHVLEHVHDDRKAITELHRILKTGGRGILLVPLLEGIDKTDEDMHASVEERWRRFGQDDHVRQYGKADFVDRLQQGGFTVRQWEINDASKELYEQNSIEEQSVLYIVSK